MEYASPVVETNLRARMRELSALFKMRIVSLLLLAGAGGAFLAAGGFPGWLPLMWMTLTGGLAAMGASALNQYLERDADARMRRTRRRPLVNGALKRARWVPWVALALIVIPALLMLPFNPALSFWSVVGAVVYVGVYTIWLKPRTMLNIVIGGFAGTCAVLCGGAAVGAVGDAAGWMQPGVLVLGLLIFLWTPTHFWSLALMCREDYARVGMPMLPTQVSPRESAGWILLHAVATGFAALALGLVAPLGWLYMLPMMGFTALLMWRSVKLLRDPSAKIAKQVFLASNSYLAVALLLICLDAML